MFGGDVGAAADKALVGLFQQAHLLRIEVEGFALFIDRLHAFEQAFAQVDIVAVGGQFRHRLFRNRLHFRAVHAFGEVEEDGSYLVEQAATVFEGEDGVLEGGIFRIIHDSSDFLGLLLHTLLYSRKIVFGFDFIKRRHAIRGFPFLHKRVVGHLLLFVAAGHH